jgi:hypothetical protein
MLLLLHRMLLRTAERLGHWSVGFGCCFWRQLL